MKILIIGGGPGGYVSAIRAAQLGADVTLVEKKYIGGTCLNVGCIPTKVLLNTVDLYDTLMKDGSALGIDFEKLAVNWDTLQNRKNNIVSDLVGGVEKLLEADAVKVLRGTGKLTQKNKAEVTLLDGSVEEVTFDKAILATGSKVTIVPIPGIDTEGILTSDEILSLEELPESLCIVGGGVIGSEFASVFSRLGVDVTIVEMLPRIIATMEETLTQYLDYSLKDSGVKILTETKVTKFGKNGDHIDIHIDSAEGKSILNAEKVLLSIGRRPVVEGLGLEALNIDQKNGIAINEMMQTSAENIYAIGDCTGGVMLAHVASAQGIAAVENIMNINSKMDFKTIPYCVYTKPEIASVGMTEADAKEKNIDYKIGSFPLSGSGKAMILNEGEGLVKFIISSETEEILGMHMVGPKATELIVEGALALRLEATVDEIVTTIHAHPTMSESVQEAAHDVFKQAIHLMY